MKEQTRRATLIGEYFSPWSEKARWALDHHGLVYDYREHVPLLGEPLLRLRSRKLTGRVSVPLLIDAGEVIDDSFRIARHVDRRGHDQTLFPPVHEQAIVEWNRRSELALAGARAAYLTRVVESRDAKFEMQPPFLPEAVRRASIPVADVAIAFLRRKYGIDSAATARAEAVCEEQLEALRAGLDKRPYLLGDGLTYADVAMAVTLQFVAPVDDRYIPLGPATRASCFHAVLASRHEDLIAWRDALYAKHRAL